MKKMNKTYITKALISLIALILMISFTACRDDVELNLSENTDVDSPGVIGDYQGFYLLNEGNMGNNKSTLDFYDFETGVYTKNIYAERNPTVPKELGDVGNDIGIYEGKLYAVINTSNKVEVMDAVTTKRIGQIDIPNCRFIKFHDGYAYVTSYAGPVIIDPNYQQLGYVAKINTTTLKQEDRCLVGFQPDELEIVDGKIYVANSGGYMGAGNTSGYERNVSVIDIATFKEEKRIDVADNLERIKADKRGNLWVSSRGDHGNLPPRLFFIDKEKQQVTDTINIPASNYWLDDDLLYAYGSEDGNYSEGAYSYHIVDTKTHEIVSKQIITDGTDKKIEKPYGIMVHPETKDIYITDAGNYVTTGILYCFDKDGKRKWSVAAGDIPAHFALLPASKQTD
jgi:DNA-binding beta-propeller fold protein YncE